MIGSAQRHERDPCDITSDDIRRTYETLRPYLRRTPILEIPLATLTGPATTQPVPASC